MTYYSGVSATATYSIGSLAAAAGVSRRTVRFYVQRDLLPPPEGLGRGAHYTAEHLARLLQIKGWQEQGVPLDEIRARLGAHREETPPGARTRPKDSPTRFPYRPDSREPAYRAPGSAWFRQPLVAGFELHVAAARPPLTARQLAMLASTLNQILENGAEEP